MKLISIIFVTLLVSACNSSLIDPDETVIVKEEIREYEVVEINRPKHFSVTLLDVQTHKLFHNHSRSKHCNNWRKNKLHEIVRIKTVYYKYKNRNSDTVYFRPVDINSHFCD